MATPPILLLGASGQVAFELQRTLSPLGPLHVAGRAAGSVRADLADPGSLRDAVRAVRPGWIVNAAAYTAVDDAEDDPATAHAVNATAPGVLAEEAAASGALLVHYSTDYVFDGTAERPYTEADPPSPLGVYGESKLAGERAIQQAGAAHLILRTAWVYGNRGRNFLNTIQRLARERSALQIVDDQHGAPTWSRHIAEATAQLLAQGRGDPEALHARSGVYHLTSAGQGTWYDFARAVVAAMPPADVSAQAIHPIGSEQFPTRARRPGYSVLANDRLQEAFGLQLPHWEAALAQCLAERCPAGAAPAPHPEAGGPSA